MLKSAGGPQQGGRGEALQRSRGQRQGLCGWRRGLWSFVVRLNLHIPTVRDVLLRLRVRGRRLLGSLQLEQACT